MTKSKNTGHGAIITVKPVKSVEKSVIDCDNLLISTGRRPYTDYLGSEELGVIKD